MFTSSRCIFTKIFVSFRNFFLPITFTTSNVMPGAKYDIDDFRSFGQVDFRLDRHVSTERANRNFSGLSGRARKNTSNVFGLKVSWRKMWVKCLYNPFHYTVLVKPLSVFPSTQKKYITISSKNLNTPHNSWPHPFCTKF